MGAEHIKGKDVCFVKKFDGPPGKLKEYKEKVVPKTKRNTLFPFMDEETKASFYQSISIKE